MGRSDEVDGNAADQRALDNVPVLKRHGFEIVRYREERGRFSDLRQLDGVPGLSGKVDDAIRTERTVGALGNMPGLVRIDP